MEDTGEDEGIVKDVTSSKIGAPGHTWGMVMMLRGGDATW